ncbi:MAG: GPR endopeptidase [Faecalibacterium sp.]|nr:GPR endopeptidase [Ruminococcus sp.]MCM1391552.1 GPR endopeptidase [Ruminococcus sp.]MCM1485485.1 GPR endopeptidase [Faecalibacterium sp.]
MNFRTDLALERREYIEKKEIDGILSEEKNENGVKVTTITVINESGERVLGKPKGRYITLEVKPFTKSSDISDEYIDVLSREINKLIPREGTVLVAGLGNERITPDALGPRCISLLLATRHIDSELAKSVGLGTLRSVAGISPGVLGQTGIETSEIIDGIVKKIKPSAVIIIDALASRKLSRLGTTVQMTDSGISPGSGVGNMRSAIDERTLGVPVVAIGVPTVVDGATMACDLLEKQGIDTSKLENETAFRKEGSMMVTPKEIDLVIERAAQFIALGINRAMQPNLSTEDILAIVK